MENREQFLKNRHRFKTFSQQVELINPDINMSYELNITSAGDSITSSFFHSALLSSLQKNFNQSYIELANKLLPISRTLPLIVHNKDKIFYLINEYIKRPFPEITGGIQNVLNLIVQLARDLGDDFYDYFNDIFINLANLFEPNDALFIDEFFRCILFLLKFLRKALFEHIENVLTLFVENYFARDKEFLRRLSAQCLAFLMRMISSKKKTHKLLFNIVSDFLISIDKNENDFNATNENKIKNENDKQNENDDEDESDDDDEDDKEEINENNKRKRKSFVLTVEVKELSKKERVIQTLGYLLYYEIKNIQNSLWSNAPDLIVPFLQLDAPFVYDAFLQMIERVSKHVSPQNVQNYLTALSTELPKINVKLTFQTFIILMDRKNKSPNPYNRVSLFNNADILIQILRTSGKECPIDILCQFLARLNDFTINEKYFKDISDIIIFILDKSIHHPDEASMAGHFDIYFVLNELKDAKKIADISSDEILAFSEANFDEVLPYLNSIFGWSRPQSTSITDSLIKKVNQAFLVNRELIVPLFQYLHNSSTYEIMTSLTDLTLSEYGVLFTLMAEFEPKLLIQQPPKFIDYLLKLDGNQGSDSINSEEALRILYHLLKTCQKFKPFWMKIDSEMFQTLFEKIDFNTPNKEIRSLGSSILYLFLDKDKEIGLMNGDELIVSSLEAIFNMKVDTLEGFRHGEAMIEHLATSFSRMRSFDRLFNVALGFSRCNYKGFRDYDSKLLGEIIKFDTNKYGNLVTDELEKTFPWERNESTNVHFLQSTLFAGIQKAEYINERIINLIENYCNYEDNNVDDEDDILKTKVALLDTLSFIAQNSQYDEKVKEIGFNFLKSTNSKIRKSSFSILYNIIFNTNRKLNGQQKDKIKNVLEAFVNGENEGILTRFPEFLDEFVFYREFIASIIINLSIGTIKEFLSEKKRNKKQYKSRSARLLQAIAYFNYEEVLPLVKSFLVPHPTSSDIRKFPKYFIALISSIPMHLNPYENPEIVSFLERSIEMASLNSREMNNSMNACSLFFDSYAGFEDFAEKCLCVLDKALSTKQQSVIRLTTSLSIQFPALFKTHDDAISKIIEKLRVQTSSDIIDIITRIITEIPNYHQDIINAYTEILQNSKLMKRESIYKSFLLFLSFMKESFATPEFIDLLIIFLVNYRHIETIPIAHGISLTNKQFSDLSKLIAYPLTDEFRKELIPLIAESMDSQYGDAFVKLNEDDIPKKVLTYRSLDSAGGFSFIFALQSFSDLQISDFALRTATVGFLSRVIQETPSIVTEYILPAIKFHVKKEHSRIPPNEILIILNTIVNTIPEMANDLPLTKVLSEQPFFLSLGSFDSKIREDAISKFTEFISHFENWNDNEISEITFPLLSQFATTEGIEFALAALCKHTSEAVIKRLLKRLIKSISHGSTIHLLIALCKANCFPPESVSPALLEIITDNKKPSATQLRLIPALLSVDHSKKVVHQVIETIAPKLPSIKEEKRKIGQQSLTELVKNLSSSDYFILFQDLRNFLKEGRQIPVLFMSLNNMLANAVNPQGAFDSFIQLFAELLLEDIFGFKGEIRIQKANEIPEAKKCLSFSSFQYLAKYITFNTTSRDLIETVLAQFKKLKTIKQSKGAKKLIICLSEGFVENESLVDAQTLVDTIVYLLDKSDEIKKEDEAEKHKSERVVYGKKYEEDFFIEKPKRSATENDDVDEIKNRLGNNYLVSLFAVRLLHVFFERDLFDIEDKQQVTLLESLLQRLWEFIKKAQDTETLVISLSILEHYIQFPSFEQFLPDVVFFLTNTISQLRNASDDFGKSVFKLLTDILTSFDKLELPTKFTRALVTFCGGQLDVHDSCDTIFDTLKLIMQRRKDIPEIYDLAKPALELVIRAISPQVRKRAALFVSQFLSTYKISPEQFQKLLQFALANLSSTKATARRSLLTFFSHLIDECPMEILDQYTELILAYFGVRIANEADEAIMAKLRKVIGNKLLLKVPGSRFLSMWDLMIKWCESGGKQVRTGLLLLSVCVEYCSDALSNLFEPLQKVVDVHINSENYKVKIAATELHRQIIIAFSQDEQNSFDLRLLPLTKLFELVDSKDTIKTGCELLYWYLSDLYSLLQPAESDLSEIANKMINVLISFHSSFKEANEALYLSLSKLKMISDINLFFDSNNELIYSIFKEIGYSSGDKTIVDMMRVFVLLLVSPDADLHSGNPEDYDLFVKNVCLFLWNANNYTKEEDDKNTKKKRSELFEASEKAIESIRHKVDVDVFTRVWTAIVQEDEERKRKESIERKVEEELDPEAYQKRLNEERERKKEEERKRRYLNDGQKPTLHPFDLDGKRIESVPLAPEFQ